MNTHNEFYKNNSELQNIIIEPLTVDRVPIAQSECVEEVFAAAKVSGEEARDGLIRTRLKCRKPMLQIETKHDFEGHN